MCNNSGRDGWPLPYTPYEGSSYGKDVLLGKSVLNRNQRSIVSRLAEVVRDQGSVDEMDDEAKLSLLDKKCTIKKYFDGLNETVETRTINGFLVQLFANEMGGQDACHTK